MIYKCFSIYDSKVGIYHPLMFLRSKGEALRAFSATANDPQSMIGKYPSDYSLFETGEWDDDTCKYVPLPVPCCLGIGHEFLNKDLHAVQPDLFSAKKDA